MRRICRRLLPILQNMRHGSVRRSSTVVLILVVKQESKVKLSVENRVEPSRTTLARKPNQKDLLLTTQLPLLVLTRRFRPRNHLHLKVQTLTILRVLQYRRHLYLSIGPMTPLLSQQKFYPAPCHRVICLTFAHQNRILFHHFNTVQKIRVVELVSLVVPIPISTLILSIRVIISHLKHLDHILTPKYIHVSTGSLILDSPTSAVLSRPQDGSSLRDQV